MAILKNIQNKICAFNIELNGRFINKVPVLFRIHENGTKTIDDILKEHMNDILNIIYKNTISIDDLLSVKMTGIIYDIVEETDEFETYEFNVTNYITYDNEYVHKLIVSKINHYSQFVLDKMGVNEHPESFVDAFKIINEHNERKISSETFVQYIMSCFYNEYGNNNDLEYEIKNIMNNKLNN